MRMIKTSWSQLESASATPVRVHFARIDVVVLHHDALVSSRLGPPRRRRLHHRRTIPRRVRGVLLYKPGLGFEVSVHGGLGHANTIGPICD